MIMRGALAVMFAVVLASCTDDLPMAPDVMAGFVPATFPLPEIVERSLPADVPLADVRVREGCFFYVSGGKLIAVTTNVGGAMLPYCIG